MAGLRGLVLGASLLLPASGGSKEIQELRIAIGGGDGESVARALEGKPMRDALGEDPASLAEVCYAADLASKRLALKYPAAAPRVAKALLELAPGDVMTGSVPERRAPIHAVLADARIRREMSKPVDAVPFLRAGEALEVLAKEEPEKPMYPVYAARAFGDAASEAGEKGLVHWDRAEHILSDFRFRHARDLDAFAEAAGLLLERVRWGAARREKGLEARIDQALSIVSEARKEDPDHRGLAAVRNDIVTLARSLDIRRPGLEYEVDRVSPCSGMAMAVPTGSRWTSSNQAPHAVQNDPVLGNVREIAISSYTWDGISILSDGSQVRGDGMKDIAGRNFDIAVGALKKVEGRRPVAVGRLPKCPQGWMFELSGLDAKGVVLRRREWYFKCTTDRRQTYRIVVLESQPGLADDPAFQSVLDSIKETPK